MAKRHTKDVISNLKRFLESEQAARQAIHMEPDRPPEYIAKKMSEHVQKSASEAEKLLIELWGEIQDGGDIWQLSSAGAAWENMSHIANRLDAARTTAEKIDISTVEFEVIRTRIERTVGKAQHPGEILTAYHGASPTAKLLWQEIGIPMIETSSRLTNDARHLPIVSKLTDDRNSRVRSPQVLQAETDMSNHLHLLVDDGIPLTRMVVNLFPPALAKSDYLPNVLQGIQVTRTPMPDGMVMVVIDNPPVYRYRQSLKAV